MTIRNDPTFCSFPIVIPTSDIRSHGKQLSEIFHTVFKVRHRLLSMKCLENAKMGAEKGDDKTKDPLDELDKCSESKQGTADTNAPTAQENGRCKQHPNVYRRWTHSFP